MMSTTSCPKCNGEMTPGFATAVRGGGPNTYTQPELWVAGPPEPSFWTGSKVSDKEHHTLVAHRCSRCAFVEFYAPGQAVPRED